MESSFLHPVVSFLLLTLMLLSAIAILAFNLPESTYEILVFVLTVSIILHLIDAAYTKVKLWIGALLESLYMELHQEDH